MKRIGCLLVSGSLAMMPAPVNQYSNCATEETRTKPLDDVPIWGKGHYPVSVPLRGKTPVPFYQQLEILSRDGTKLTVHHWAPPKAPPDKPVVIFLHGIGMHGEPYEAIAAGFTARELTLIVPDLRGHGRSQGKRGNLADPRVLRADLGEVIGLVNRLHPQAPVILAGESMGGLLAADYAWRGERRLAGLALLAPAFKLNRSQVDFDELRKNLFRWFQEGVPLDDDAKLAVSTRDKGFGKARQADNLALHKVPPEYLFAIMGLQDAWPGAAANLKLPLFIGVAGKDKIVDRAIIKAVYEATTCPKEDKVWVEWDQAFHTMCWDPLTPQVIDELVTWAVQRSK